MGLRDGHPEKEGVLVELANVAEEVKQRLLRKQKLDEMTTRAEGLRVIHGIRGEEIKSAVGSETAAAPAAAVEETPAPAEPVDGTPSA